MTSGLFSLKDDQQGRQTLQFGLAPPASRQWHWYTARLCWPASVSSRGCPTSTSLKPTHVPFSRKAPSDFILDYAPSTASRSSQLSSELVISSTSTGLRRASTLSTREIPYTILVEPVYFGGIPETCLPLIALIIGLLGLIWISGLSERVVVGFEMIARRAEGDKVE